MAKASLDDLWESDGGGGGGSAPAPVSAKPSLDDLWKQDETEPKNAGPPSGPTPAAPPTSTLTDVAKSAAQGVAIEGTEGLAGLPGDISRGARWLGNKVTYPLDYGMAYGQGLIEKALGKLPADQSLGDFATRRVGEVNNLIGSKEPLPSGADVNQAGKAAGLPDYQPQTTAGKYAKTVGQFVPGALTMPETEIGPIVGNLIKYALAPGIASEAGGQAFQGTPSEPYVRMAAGLAGGLSAEGLAQGARAGYGAAKQFAEPLTQAGQESLSARKLQSLVADPDAAKNALAIAKAQQTGDFVGPLTPSVPGSLPTTGQLTGDKGLLASERAMATRDPAFFKSNPFGTGSEQQNAARVGALEGIQPIGSPEAVGQAVRDQLASIEAEHDATNSAALKAAQDAASDIGSGAAPEDIGANLRDALQTGRDTAKTNERELWSAVDPDGTLAMPATPIAQAAKNVVKAVAPTAEPMGGEESAIFETAASLPPVAPFSDVTALRSRISTAMRKEMRESGQTPTYARLGELRGAVEDAISGAVENQAAAESQAVASGAMAPEMTMEARLQQDADEFIRQRTTSANSGTGVQDAGAPGLSGQALSPNMDEAAASRLKIASAATKDRAQTYDQGPVGQILKTRGQAGDYSLANAAVPAKLFSPGPAGAQAIAAYQKAAGPNAEHFLHDAAAQSLSRNALREDGTIDPKKYQDWADAHQDALRALPDSLRAKFANAASAGKALAEAAATRKAALDHYQQSAVKPFLKLSNPQDVTRTVGGIFESKDGVRRMSELAAEMKANPDAQQGLRKAVADYILSKAKGTTEAGTSGIENLNASRFQTLIRNNAQTLKAAGFSGEEIGLMHAIGEDLQRGQRTLGATKLPGQSNTVQDLHLAPPEGFSVKSHGLSLLGEIMAGGLGGFLFGGAHGSLIGGLSGLGEHVARQFVTGLRNAGIAKADTLVRDAMFNPELARALLEKAPRKVGAGAYADFRKAIARMAAFSTETGDRGVRKPRASGGTVKSRMSHEDLVSRLMARSEEAKKATKRETKAILNVNDNVVAKALEVAQRAI